MQPKGEGKSDSSSNIHSKVYTSDHSANRNVQIKKDDRMPEPNDPDWTDVEEYMPNGAGGHSESQLLYVALGVVFGLVALVTVICIIMCMVKQHRQQQTLGKTHLHTLIKIKSNQYSFNWKNTTTDTDAKVVFIIPMLFHLFILVISLAPLQVLYFSEALPTTARILYRSFTPKRTGNCR